MLVSLRPSCSSVSMMLCCLPCQGSFQSPTSWVRMNLRQWYRKPTQKQTRLDDMKHWAWVRSGGEGGGEVGVRWGRALIRYRWATSGKVFEYGCARLWDVEVLPYQLENSSGPESQIPPLSSHLSAIQGPFPTGEKVVQPTKGLKDLFTASLVSASTISMIKYFIYLL